ncbi:hypothetical protein SAMN05660865_00872 [Caloramator fervidus]|uniref:Uncharacterized protein n=1 Tax=Caloramator fervidus TaxID=29344 RepID=A0A1H5UEV0_9CLOT|nr:hypothetical protein SAMN05660865_00872 [Caloramator fervidus]
MYRGEILEERQLKEIFRDEIGKYLKEIADALKPKEKINYLLGILWGIVGLTIMYILYVIFKILESTMSI